MFFWYNKIFCRQLPCGGTSLRIHGGYPRWLLPPGVCLVYTPYILSYIKNSIPPCTIPRGCPHQTLLPGVGCLSYSLRGYYIGGIQCQVYYTKNWTFYMCSHIDRPSCSNTICICMQFLEKFMHYFGYFPNYTSEFGTVLLPSLAKIFH